MAIINYDKKIERELTKLKKLPAKNQKTIKQYYNEYCVAEGLKKSSKFTRLFALRKTAEQLDKTLEELTEKDFTTLKTIWRGEKDYSTHTINTRVQTITTFCRWAAQKFKGKKSKRFKQLCKPKRDGGKALKQKNPYVNGGKISRNKVPTSQEIIKLIQASKNKRDKAMIATLAGAGLRVSEAGDLNWEDVTWHKDGSCSFFVSGKTGKRQVKLRASLAWYVKQWFNETAKASQQDPVFCSLHTGKRIRYANVWEQLKRLLKRAGINKKITPHCLRHHHCTWLLQKGVQNQLIKKRLGWEANSPMLQVYSHLTAKDVNKAYDLATGEESAEDDEVDVLGWRTCTACGKKHPPTFQVCGECNSELAVGVQEEKEKRMVEEVMENEGKEQLKQELLQELLKAMGLKSLNPEKVKAKAELAK